MKGIDAVRHELRYRPAAVIGRWRNGRDVRRKRRILRAWFERLERNPPDVLTGANVSMHNGIRHHIDGIARYSSLSVGLFPPDDVMREVSYHDMHTTLNDDVMAFRPAGVGAVHSHVYPYFIDWCRRSGPAGALWVHTYHLPYFADGGELEPWAAEINRALVEDARHAHVRLSVSRWQQHMLEREHGISTDYLPNGVDVAFCDSVRPGAFSERTGLRDYVLFVGRNDRQKNPADFVRLAERLPSLRFVMIGKELSAASLLADWQVESPANITFFGDTSREDVQSAIADASLLVVTSNREGLPTLVLEAMTHRKRIVVSDDAGCVEAVGGGEFGRVYRRHDVDDLASAVRSALESDPHNERSRERVLDEYDWRVIAPRMDAIYRSAGER
jgi:glycosyltransferase involved in cell wall biosynthesis